MPDGVLRLRALFVVLALILAACATSVSSGDNPIDNGGEDAGTVPGDLSPGTVDIRTLVMADGTHITFGLILPDGFDPSLSYPTLLALPPGGQDIDLTISVAESLYLSEATSRGWVVITPAAPAGTLFFQGSEKYIPEFLEALDWIEPEGGLIHIAGVSNGGRSTFRIAALNPTLFASIVVYPGFPGSDADKEALDELAHLPFAMFVGSQDTGWLREMETTRDTLVSLGADVLLDIREGEGHIIASLADGKDIFDALDRMRSSR